MEEGALGVGDTPCPWVAGGRFVPIHLSMRGPGAPEWTGGAKKSSNRDVVACSFDTPGRAERGLRP